MLNHMNSPGKDPREFNPDIDDDLLAVLVKAIERDPRDRYQTALEFRDALKALPQQHY
jgi:serine/threonine protein kinase